jgi:hypothetical protein
LSLADGEPLVLHVDVLPADPEDLAAAHPGARRQVERREELVVPDAVEELAQLVGGPDLHLRLRCRRELGWVGEVGDIALHAPFALCVGQRLAKDAVDVADGLDREPSAVAVQFPLDEKLGVELIEVLG